MLTVSLTPTFYDFDFLKAVKILQPPFPTPWQATNGYSRFKKVTIPFSNLKQL
jgi:hypothetical protein